MSSTHKGMNTYTRILQDARVNGKPIGPSHFKLDLQRKLYDAQQRHILTQTREAKSVVISSTPTKEAVKAKVLARASVPRQPTLEDKYRAEQIKKLADALKVEERNPECKSVGNGL